MTPAKLRKRINLADAKIQGEISANAAHSRLASAMASEGYAGGYRDALRHVLLLLNDVEPNDDRGYWRVP